MKHDPYLSLWQAALKQYLDDAMQYHRNGQRRKNPDPDQLEAYRDLTKGGLMLDRICDKTGHDPEYLRDLFNRYVCMQTRQESRH